MAVAPVAAMARALVVSDRAAIERAQQARTLRENPLLDVLLQEIEDETVARWASAEEIEVREECWQLLQALHRLQIKIEAAIGGGTLALARQAKERRQ